MFNQKHGQTIKFFLMDADPEGRLICELSNWTGKAFRIPRFKVKDCANRDDLKSTAVYMLFGKTESNPAKPLVYIGETENAYKRLGEHLAKDFWNEAVVFISKDENLNKAHIKYLESRLYEIAKETNRCILKNEAAPTRSAISESDQADMELFIDHLKMLINTMGFRIFEKLIKDNELASCSNDLFYLKGARGAKATGKRTANGFVILEGSQMTPETVASARDGIKILRTELVANGIIINSDGNLVFSADYEASSSSTAANIILGRSANGRTEWKNSEKKTLKEIEEAELTTTQ